MNTTNRVSPTESETGSTGPETEAPDGGWRVGEVARLAHVTVRTLHHYDEIGLLMPSSRSGAGYRRYSEGDLRRLHQVLLFRELGFSLEAIQHLLSDPNYDRKAALEAQRELLHERLRRTETILQAVDAALQDLNGETTMSTEEMFEGFEDFNKQYEDEARERWGGSPAYEESMRRTKGYTKADWKRFKEESDQGMQRFAELLASGAEPSGVEAMDLAEGARQAITKWFYDCSPSMHRNLADMYEADPRFTATYEKHGMGMAAFVAAAIRANADRQEAS